MMFAARRFAVLGLIGLALGPLAHAQGFHTEPIRDPALNMKAYDVSIPNGWKFQGTFMAGDSCSQLSSPVWRAYSPDGLSEFRRLPRFDWSWSNAPYAPKPQGDCLPLTRDVSAQEFVRYIGNMLKLQWVGEAQEPGFADAWQKNIAADNAAIQARAGQRPFRGGTAAGRFEDQNGSFTIEEQVRAGVRCTHQDMPGFSGQRLFGEECSADVRILRAPKGKLDALVASLDANGGVHEDPRWTNAIIAIMQQQTRANDERTRQIMAARQTQFQHDQAVRAEQNKQYQASTQARYDSQNRQHAEVQGMYDQHNKNEMQNMNARHTPASDWVDLALNQQTVTGTGGVAVKVSSDYTQTWANGQGQYYQTNNLNTNPNGSLPGNWSLQTPVHGNGNPY